MRFFASQILLTTIPVVLSMASVLYLLTNRYGREDPEIRHWHFHTGTAHVLRLGVLVGLAGMVFVATLTGGRTIPFFAVAAIVGGLVYAQIFFLQRSDLEPVVVLVQIVAFALILRGVALVTTPGLIGVDAWRHLPDFAHSIRETGQLSAIADSKYYVSPLYHLLVVFAADAFGTSLRTALYATLGLVLPLSTVFMYYITRYVLPVRWALFSAATFGIADQFVRWGIHIIPTSMGLVFFIVVFYVITRIYYVRESMSVYALVIFFTVAIVLTHQISMFVTLVFLGAGVIAQLYLRYLFPTFSPNDPAPDDNHVNFVGIFLIALFVTVVNWSISPRQGESFLSGMLEMAFTRIGGIGLLDLASTSTTVSGAVKPMLVTVPVSIKLLDSLGFLVLLLVALVGGYTLLRHTPLNLLPLTLILATGLMLVVTLGMPLFGLYFLIPGRWYAFMYVPMIVLSAYGLQHFELHLPSRQLVGVLLVFTLLFTAPMLINHSATRENPVHEEAYSQFAYSESELAAAETISTIHPEGETLHTDHPYYLFFRNAKLLTARPLEIREDGKTTGEYVVYRRYQSEAGPNVLHQGSIVRVQLSADEVCRPSMDVLYSNAEVRYCHRGAS